MRIWYDACTGKHVRYGSAIAEKLRKNGHEMILTTRRHPDTLPMIEYLDEEFLSVGEYDPRSLFTRLKGGLRRQLLLAKIFERRPLDVAVSHGSVDQCRVAFGLGKPVISTVDTPYAQAVHRLTLPLTKYIVASKAIPQEILQQYNIDADMVSFDGVDEVAWIKKFKPEITCDFGKPLIVVRQLEEKAAYTNAKVNMLALARKLTKLGKVAFLSRYERKKIKNLIIPKGFVDSASLVAQADLFVGVGGTITREAALQGTPAIVVDLFSGQYVNEFLAAKGFPIFRIPASKVMATAKKEISKKRDVKAKLEKLQNPVDVIADIVKKLDKN